MHEADEPNAVGDLFDAEQLAGEDGGDVDFLPFVADSAAVGDQRDALRGLRRNTRVQREAPALGNLRPRRVRLSRQRLQGEHFLALSGPGSDPVGDRRPEQAADRRLFGRIEGETGIVDSIHGNDLPASIGELLTFVAD